MNNTTKQQAWTAANSLMALWLSRDCGLEPVAYSCEAWHGDEFVDEAGWPTLTIGEICVVDFIPDGSSLLIQVTGPSGCCYEESVDWTGADHVALALIDVAMEDEA